MRAFKDEQGRAWEAVAGRESWGAIVVIFVPLHEGLVRQAPLAASGYEEANAQLEGMEDAALRNLLARSRPHDPGA